MEESIYGSRYPALKQAAGRLMEKLEGIRKGLEDRIGMDPVEHLLFRIKSEESMREKCRRKNLPETTHSALTLIHDAIGIRVVCPFLDDVYSIRDALLASPGIKPVEEKDYIRHAKPNGYRSLHLILFLEEGFYAELQLRTISMDTWAALEHHLKYKKSLGKDVALIEAELKRCAEELAGTDLSMQTIRDMISSEPSLRVKMEEK